MFRRLLAILLISSYVAGQWAALPHAHASQPAGHGTRPHVHGDWLVRLVGCGASEHCHDNGLVRHRHRHAHPHEAPPGVPLPADSPGHEHDDNCVYLPDAVTGLQENRPADQATHGADLAGTYQGTAVSAAAASRSGRQRPPIPGDLAGGCPLFLLLRALRI